MGIDISKLALQAARGAIGNPQSGGSNQAARKRPRKRSRVRDHLPSAWPLVTGAAAVVAARAAIRSRGGDWLHALEERVGMADAVSENDDREPDLDDREPDDDEPQGLQEDEVEDEADEGAEDFDAEEAPEEEDDTAEAEPDAASDDDDDAADEPSARPVAFAPRSRMSPVRRRKLAESAARAKS